eukprot:scaffold187360_cov48-Prasinocladus_malaysianus.AAC.2
MQIKVDSKGLAASFAFGLPGFAQEGHTVCAVAAALNIFAQSIQRSGMKFTAGIGSGPCFCGLVGSSKTRTEYTVMGGAPYNIVI